MKKEIAPFDITIQVFANSTCESVKDDAEKALLLAVLTQNRYNKSQTAEQLAIDRKTLYNKIVKLGLK